MSRLRVDIAPQQRIPLSRTDAEVSIWLSDLTYSNAKIVSDTFPIGVASVASFTEHNLGLAHPIRIFKYPATLAEALETKGVPAIVGFSNFVWNSELSLAFARRIKQHAPDTIIVFGGPHYPLTAAEQEAYLRAHPEIDFYIPKEGELAFSNLIATLIEADLDPRAVGDALLSVHSIDPDGCAHITGPLPRLADLTEIPSPYTTGKMDPFFDGVLMPIIQTNRGCPFKCAFCDEGVSYYNKVNRHAQWQVDEEIEYIARKMKRVRELGGRNDLRIADSNFAMYKQDLDTCRTIRRCQEKYDWPHEILSDTGKNKRERVIQAAELVNHVLRLTGSVQSLTPTVMENIQRSNISSDALMQLALEAAQKDISSRCELILSLPGETRESHFASIGEIIEAGFNHVITYQLGILPGSEMFLPENREKFAMTGRFRVMADCIGSYDVLGETIVAGELEEICMATNTMPFDDYVACRKMHLLISIFYNNVSVQTNSRTSQPLFQAVMKFLRWQEISVQRWMTLLFEEELGDDLREVFDRFEQATRDELWENSEAVQQFVQQPEVVEQYLSGTLGYNILHSFRIVIQTRFCTELVALAQTTLEMLLRESGKDSPENRTFVVDLLRFDASRITNISRDLETTPTLALHFDVPAFLADQAPTSVERYRLEQPRTIHFRLSGEQRVALERSIQLEYEDSEKDILSTIGNSIVSSQFARASGDLLLRTPTTA